MHFLTNRIACWYMRIHAWPVCGQCQTVGLLMSWLSFVYPGASTSKTGERVLFVAGSCWQTRAGFTCVLDRVARYLMPYGVMERLALPNDLGALHILSSWQTPQAALDIWLVGRSSVSEGIWSRWSDHAWSLLVYPCLLCNAIQGMLKARKIELITSPDPAGFYAYFYMYFFNFL